VAGPADDPFMTTRDAEDIGRPDVITPSNTTPTEPKRHSRLQRGVDVLPPSSFCRS
jgi:hypothetical protein